MTQIMKRGSRAVVINTQPGMVWANLYVNATSRGIDGADITLTRWQGKTVKGAERWAEKVLSRYPPLASPPTTDVRVMTTTLAR